MPMRACVLLRACANAVALRLERPGATAGKVRACARARAFVRVCGQLYGSDRDAEQLDTLEALYRSLRACVRACVRARACACVRAW